MHTPCLKFWDNTAHGMREKDAKLNALEALLTQSHPEDKVLVFTQFADTVRYLNNALFGAWDDSSSGGNGRLIRIRLNWHGDSVLSVIIGKTAQNELRVLISTDILSEGQNLQDCSIVVNYDLPWAIIRLVQRAGRVDRIGQEAEKILCYSFLPAEGVERIIKSAGACPGTFTSECRGGRHRRSVF